MGKPRRRPDIRSRTDEVAPSSVKSKSAEAAPRRGLRFGRGSQFILPYLPFLILFGIHRRPTRSNSRSRTSTAASPAFQLHPDSPMVPVPAGVQACPHLTSVWLGALVVFVVALALLLHGRASRVSSTFRFLFYLPGALAGRHPCSCGCSCSTRPSVPGRSCEPRARGAPLRPIDRTRASAVHLRDIAFWTGAGGWIVVMYGALNTIRRISRRPRAWTAQGRSRSRCG